MRDHIFYPKFSVDIKGDSDYIQQSNILQISFNAMINESTEINDNFKLLKMFTQITRIHVKLLDSAGVVTAQSSGVQFEHLFCQIISSQTTSCNNFYQKSCQEAIRWGDTYLSPCHFGLLQMSVPILHHEEMIGGLVACPFFMRKPTEQTLRAMWKRFDCDQKRFSQFIENIPLIPEKRVKLASDLLYSMADYFSKPDLGMLHAKRELNKEQAQVAEEIQRFKKDAPPSAHHLLPILNLNKEKELITKVRLGDKIGAKKILNEFLGQVMLHNPINIELIKAYILELAIILTRAVVEQGANAENILGLRYQFVSELSDIADQEKLCFWVVKVMESICDNIYRTRNNNHYRILEQACTFIQKNYSNKLTLETVAKEIYISPFYLCHLYKEELQTTFGEFLTKTRIDAAKSFLRESDMSLAQIALEVGYPDQSYFTKVFKKIEQITPKTYRRLTAAVL